jgi:hypothetical protein
MDKNKLTVEQYHKLMKDTENTDGRIRDRLDYLDAFLRNIIRIELEKYRNGNLLERNDNNAFSAKPNYTP